MSSPLIHATADIAGPVVMFPHLTTECGMDSRMIPAAWFLQTRKDAGTRPRATGRIPDNSTRHPMALIFPLR